MRILLSYIVEFTYILFVAALTFSVFIYLFFVIGNLSLHNTAQLYVEIGLNHKILIEGQTTIKTFDKDRT